MPQKGTNDNVNEKAFPTHMTALAFAIIPVKSVEEGRVDQGTWPYHARRPDNELAEDATNRKSENLRSNRKKNLVAQRSCLAIEDAGGEDDLSRVCTSNADVSHDGDTNVLLDGKRARVERPLVTESVELLPGKNTGKSMAKGE